MSLETTYPTLTRSRHDEVVDVLNVGIREGDAATRRLCLQSLCRRNCKRSRESLIRHWPAHQNTILDVIGENRDGLAKSVMGHLESGNASESFMRTLCQLTSSLDLRDVLPKILELAWHHPSHLVRAHCVETVSAMTYSWGRLARRNYLGQRIEPTLERRRLEISQQLLVAVSQFQKHRCDDLLDAFLMISHWNDPALKTAFSDESSSHTLLVRRLRTSKQLPVLELLAGFICRKTPPDSVLGLVLQRNDAIYREALLQQITESPTPTTLGNLKEFGLPGVLRGGTELLRSLGHDRDAALAYAYTMSMPQSMETIDILLEILDRHHQKAAGGDSASDRACDVVAICLARCETPPIEFWIDALQSDVLQRDRIHGHQTNRDRTDEDQRIDEASAGASSYCDRCAEVLSRLTDWMISGETKFSKLAARLLSELNIQNALSLFPNLEPIERIRLGKILMRIDPSTMDVVRDGLRHAVMRRRLEAIEFTQTLGLVDLMIEPLANLVRNDHQSARLAVAEALGEANSQSSADLLREITASPHGSLRDAALKSLEKRGILV